MSFTSKLRLALVTVAVAPLLLIAIIVLIGTSNQVKQIEYREALAAVDIFKENLQRKITDISLTLNHIIESRDFQLMEMGRVSGRPVTPGYRLPLFTLDFIEYSDAHGTAVMSAERPALVGRQYFNADSAGTNINPKIDYVFESDLTGRHPALRLAIQTGNGILSGGIYFDGRFKKEMEPILKGQIYPLSTDNELALAGTRWDTNNKVFRESGFIKALLSSPHNGEFCLQTTFTPVNTGAIFSNFLLAVGAVALFSLLLVIPIGVYFAGQTKRQMSGLMAGVSRVAEGDFSRAIVAGPPGEFSDLADSFNQMMRQLENYRERLVISEKIAAWQTLGRKIAHEVKNPLTPIAIAAEDLYRSYKDNDKDFAKILDGSTRTIKSEVNRLRKLLEEFSSFARMPAPDIIEFAIDPWLDEIKILFQEEIESEQLSIKCESELKTLRGDPDQLRQVIINLIKNAKESGASKYKLELHNDDNRVCLNIEDDGSGFSKELIDGGIIPYFSTKAGGSGLGLVICQRIIHDHYGHLQLSNKPEGGARVNIRLPLNDDSHITDR